MVSHSIPTLEAPPTSVNRTEAALIAREVDNALAAKLRHMGWTLSKLQQQDDDKLSGLGLSLESIHLLRSSGRPDIPFADLVRSLIANRFTCCVCHDPKKAIIVHHINPWAESHDHSPANLAVLCQDHHDKAHSRSTLTRNLDATVLSEFKAKWEEYVGRSDAEALLNASRIHTAAWWYFNHLRLFKVPDRGSLNPSPLGEWDLS